GQDWAATSYSANFQLFGSTTSGNARMARYSIGNIPDGTSNTIGYAEKYGGSQSDNGALWAYPGPAWANQYDALVGNQPAYASWNQGPQPTGTLQTANDFGRANSIHSGICLVGLMDGSARSVSSTVQNLTWQLALTPADGTPLP